VPLLPSTILLSVLPAYLLILLGMVLRRGGVVRQEHDQPVMHVVFHVMYPCFLLDKILGSSSLSSGWVVGWSFAVGFMELLLGLAIGLAAGRLMRLERGSGLRTFCFSVGIQNFGYTAIPVTQELFAAAVPVLIVHNLGVELSIWTLGVILMTNDRKIPWKKLLNGPAVAVVVGLALVGLGWDGWVTGPVRESMRLLGSGAFPLALTMTGALMFDMMKVEKPSLRIAGGGALLRLGLIPVVLLAFAKWLPMPLELKQVLLVQAAMPAAMSPLLIARLYGGRPGIAAQIIIVTTALSLFTLPWVINVGAHWLEIPLR
jgi:predicted permease